MTPVKLFVDVRSIGESFSEMRFFFVYFAVSYIAQQQFTGAFKRIKTIDDIDVVDHQFRIIIIIIIAIVIVIALCSQCVDNDATDFISRNCK